MSSDLASSGSDKAEGAARPGRDARKGTSAEGPRRGSTPKGPKLGAAAGDPRVATPMSVFISEARPPVPPAAPLPAIQQAEDYPRQLLDALMGPEPGADRPKPPVGSTAVPEAAETVPVPFPPPFDAEPAHQTELGAEVLHREPAGAVPEARLLSITFSMPMVAEPGPVSDPALVPVVLSPTPPGRWYWVGRRTLVFEPEGGRFPMATRYRATLRPTARSPGGGVIVKRREWAFSTPPPAVVHIFPAGEPASPDTPIFLELDQRVDPKAVLARARLSVGGEDLPLRLVSREEVVLDPLLHGLAAAAPSEHWVAFRPERQLPIAARVRLSLREGLPSLEGPRRTEKPWSGTFRTVPRFEVVGVECNWGRECRPGQNWDIELSSPLDLTTFDPELLSLEPEVKGLIVEPRGPWIHMRGLTDGATTYRLTLDRALRDIHGQTLGTEHAFDVKVGSSKPRLFASGRNIMVLDPTRPLRWPVYSINHSQLRFRAYAVQTGDWYAYLGFQSYLYQPGGDIVPPGRLLINRVVDVEGRPDAIVRTELDLSDAFPGGFGHAIVVVEPVVPHYDGPRRQVVHAWLQATRLALSAAIDRRKMSGWITDIEDGRPLADVAVTLLPGGASGQTDANGLVTLPLLEERPTMTNSVIVRRGQDSAILPETDSYWGFGKSWHQRDVRDRLRWYVLASRERYRPGDTAQLKGWLRRVGRNVGGDVFGLKHGIDAAGYAIYDGRGKSVGSGQVSFNSAGGFELDVPLPADAVPGRWRLVLEPRPLDKDVLIVSHTHWLEVQEATPAAWVVQTRPEPGPLFAGAGVVVTAKAAHTSGAALTDAEVRWTVATEPTHFEPPGFPDFFFGIEDLETDQADLRTRGQLSGRSDATGSHAIRLDFSRPTPPRASAVTTEVTFVDHTGRHWGDKASLVVHPAETYLGLLRPRRFINRGETLDVLAVAVDLDGHAVPGLDVAISAEPLGDAASEAETQWCRTTSGEEPLVCTFAPGRAGAWAITGTLRSPSGRVNTSRMALWVAGPLAKPPEELTLIPSQDRYAPGDTAEILVLSPAYPAFGRMMLRRTGVVREEPFVLNGPYHLLEVPIRGEDVPNLHVVVEAVSALPEPEDAASTAPENGLAVARAELSVPPARRRLELSAHPAGAMPAPGSQASIEVQVADAEGHQVPNAELTAIVSLCAPGAQPRLADPLDVYYEPRDEGTDDYYVRSLIAADRPQDVAETLARLAESSDPYGGGVDYLETTDSIPGARLGRRIARQGGSAEPASRARPATDGAESSGAQSGARVLLFKPALRTNKHGRAALTFDTPNEEADLRIEVLAVAAGHQFGQATFELAARRPIAVKPRLPGALTQGDGFQLGVEVSNRSSRPRDIGVGVAVTGASLVAGEKRLQRHGKRVRVPANGTVQVGFEAVADAPGTATFEVRALAGADTAKATTVVPVEAAVGQLVAAVSGDGSPGPVRQPLRPVSGLVDSYGGLRVTVFESGIYELDEAVAALLAPGSGSTDELAARIRAAAAFVPLKGRLGGEMGELARRIVARAERDVDELGARQLGNGGFTFWRTGTASWPEASLAATDALLRADAAGITVPARNLRMAGRYLESRGRRSRRKLDPATTEALQAWSLALRHRMHLPVTELARQLIAEVGVEKLGAESLAWLMTVFGENLVAGDTWHALRAQLEERLTASGKGGGLGTAYDPTAPYPFAVPGRPEALLLEALRGQPGSSELSEALAHAVMERGRRGGWPTAAAKGVAIAALAGHFAEGGPLPPPRMIRLWLGDELLLAGPLGTERLSAREISIPLARYERAVAAGEPLTIDTGKTPGARYRLSFLAAAARTSSPAIDRGFAIARRLEAVDDPGDVVPMDSATWWVRRGARVRVHLSVASTEAHRFATLFDPLVGGFEPLYLDTERGSEGRHATSEGGFGAESNGGAPPRWPEHQELTPARAIASTSLLPAGVHTFAYVVRAVTPGEYLAAPSKARELFDIRSEGASPSQTVIIR